MQTPLLGAGPISLKRYRAIYELLSPTQVLKFPPGVARPAAVRRLLGAGPIPLKRYDAIDQIPSPPEFKSYLRALPGLRRFAAR